MDTLLAINTLRQHKYIGFKKICRTRTVIPTKSTAVDLVHRIYGPSPTPNSVPIIVLHGLLGCKRNWQSMCKKITSYTNKTVIAVDARNHGDSPHSDAHGYFDLAADVSRLITKFAIQKGIIIGHSMGGRTGMVLALTEPSKVASLIVVDISPVSTTSSLRDFFPRVLEVMTTVDFKGLDLNNAQTAAKTVIMENELFRRQDDMYFILMNIGKLPDKTFGWKCNLKAIKKNFHNIASFPNEILSGRTYSGPTLFVGGKKSRFIPPDDLSGIQRFFPKAILHYIDGVGHNVHAGDPNAFFNVVVQFISYNEKN